MRYLIGRSKVHRKPGFQLTRDWQKSAQSWSDNTHGPLYLKRRNNPILTTQNPAVIARRFACGMLEDAIEIRQPGALHWRRSDPSQGRACTTQPIRVIRARQPCSAS